MATNRSTGHGRRVTRSKGSKTAKVSARNPTSAMVAGIRISHPDRVIYPDLGISKIQLVRYYERIGGWIMPHVIGEKEAAGKSSIAVEECHENENCGTATNHHEKVISPTLRPREHLQPGAFAVTDLIRTGFIYAPLQGYNLVDVVRLAPAAAAAVSCTREQ
jgi:hypothetical protein